jgi:two-component system, OmpR family, copper resistance phosphate regulon response regulator CusR
MRLLVVEDDVTLNHGLMASLQKEGFEVDTAFDGQQGQEMAEAAVYDVIILDVLLPEQDGIDVCRALRRQRIMTPILLLTARDAVDDRVRGLDSGADDYLVKPFAFQELLARVRALVRRAMPEQSPILTVADLTADPASHRVQRGGRDISLSAKEFALLEYFLRHPNQILTRQLLESHVWSYDFVSESNVVEVGVGRLRRKIDDPFRVKLLETVRGVGYRLRVPRSPSPE